eukprot:5850375-Prymnesium_polylepis.1
MDVAVLHSPCKRSGTSQSLCQPDPFLCHGSVASTQSITHQIPTLRGMTTRSSARSWQTLPTCPGPTGRMCWEAQTLVSRARCCAARRQTRK